MSEIAKILRGPTRMTDTAPSREQLERLHRKMRAAATRRWRLPDVDVDDVVVEALADAANENIRAHSPDFETRAFAALEDAAKAYLRRRDAKKRPDIDRGAEVPEESISPNLAARLELGDLLRELREALGREACQFAIMRVCGLSEREIAEQPGWDRLRAGRVRRALERAAVPELLQQLVDPTIANEEAS